MDKPSKWQLRMAAPEVSAYVARLEQRIAEQEWVSVEERLPDAIGHYLYYTEKEVGWAFYNSNGQWAACPNELVASVTHWMPPPKPPQEQPAAGGDE